MDWIRDLLEESRNSLHTEFSSHNLEGISGI